MLRRADFGETEICRGTGLEGLALMKDGVLGRFLTAV